MKESFYEFDPYGEEIWDDKSRELNPDKPLGDCECGQELRKLIKNEM